MCGSVETLRQEKMIDCCGVVLLTLVDADQKSSRQFLEMCSAVGDYRGER